MDKNVLIDYIDACENIKDIEKDIQSLKKRKQRIIQTNVTGSNPNFPYEKQHFKIQGIEFDFIDEKRLQINEKILEERKANAEEQRIKVEEWLNTIPNRMQRIIRYRVFERKSWEQVANKMGRKATGESVRKEYSNFMK